MEKYSPREKKPMKTGHVILAVFLSAALASGASYYAANARRGDVQSSATKETRLEQVKRTGVLRCGYVNWPPFTEKDANTGRISGLTYDLTEEIGRQLKLKIEWTGEVSTGSMLADLNLGRFDMICSPFAMTPGRAREADFSLPFVYSPVYMYARKDDTRFDNNFDAANKPEIAFAVLDGEFSSIGAHENFPGATKVSIPQLLNSADLYMAVASKKADAVIQDPYTFADYDAANPGVLRAAGNKPLRMLAVGMPIPSDEPALKATLNTTMAYLHDSGFIDKMLKKYESKARMYRAAKSYAEPEEQTP
jgi:polar amino acid transport system substrate-binding protein